jgi:hypothetical protein
MLIMLLPLTLQAISADRKSAIDEQVRSIAQTRQIPEPPFVNPFAPATKPAASAKRTAPPPPPRLRSILGKRALIGSSWVAAGESVAGYKVEAVLADSVTLSRSGRVLRLQMQPLSDQKILRGSP